MWGKLGGRRIEFHGGRPLDSVKSQIEQADGPIGNQFDVQGAVAFALLAANLEEIGEIGRARAFDRKTLRHRFVASQGNTLVAAGVSQEFGAIPKPRFARSGAHAVRSLTVRND